MSKAAKSIFIFGLYLGLAGIALVLIPNLLLRVFGVPAAQDVWVRVGL
jgi:hypothetical protein